MIGKRRIIRKVQPDRHTPVDDQLWPLVVAASVLGGFLAGTVLAYLRLNDPRWYANAWTWLIAIPLLLSIVLTWLAVTGNRVLRRTMQLALVLCAIVHVILFILAVETHIFSRAWFETLQRTPDEKPRRVARVPEYFSWQHDPEQRARSALEQPVPTTLPDPEVPHVSRQSAEQDPVAREQPRPVTQPERTVQPRVVRQDQPDAAVPRQRPEQARLSRRQAPQAARPNQLAAVPDVPRAAPRPTRITEQSTPAERSQPAGAPATRTPVVPPNAVPEPGSSPPVSSPRTSPVEPTADRGPSAPAYPRRLAQPRQPPRADVQSAPQPAIARQTDPQAPQPSNTLAQKQQTVAPQVRPVVEQPVSEVPQTVQNRRQPRLQVAELQPDLAATPQPVPNRRSRLTERPELAVVATPHTAGPESAATRPNPQPAQTALDRSPQTPTRPSNRRAVAEPAAPSDDPPASAAALARQDPAAMPTSRDVARAPARTAPAPVRSSTLAANARQISPPDPVPRTPQQPTPAAGRVAVDRAESTRTAVGNRPSADPRKLADAVGDAPAVQPSRPSRSAVANTDRPSVMAQADVDNPPRRAVHTVPQAASAVNLENPALPSVPVAPAASRPEPQSLALSRAETGVAGGFSGRNLGDAATPARGQAPRPSASAQRSQAIQDLPPGPALTPAAPSLARTGRAGRAQPSTTRVSVPSPALNRAGSRRPEDVAANAGAALTRSASNAPAGPVTAAVGTAAVDIGPTMQVTRTGANRADGGGQPELVAGTMTGVAQRSPVGQSTPPSLASDQVAALPAAPAAAGGGRRRGTATEPRPASQTLARTSNTGQVPGGVESRAAGALDGAASGLTPLAAARANGMADGPESAHPTPVPGQRVRRTGRSAQTPAEPDLVDMVVGAAAGADLQEQTLGEPAAAPLAAARPDAGGPNGGGVGARADSEPLAGGRPSLAALQRAEPVEGVAAAPERGGGNSTLSRAAAGPRVMANVAADVPQLAGMASSSGEEKGQSVSSQGIAQSRFPAGLPAVRTNGPVGTLDAKTTWDGPATSVPGLGPADPARASAAGQGPVMIAATEPAGIVRQRVAQPTTPGSDQPVPLPTPPGPPDQGDIVAGPAAMLGDTRLASADRAGGEPLPVDLQAPDDAGGLGPAVTIEVGVQRREARLASEQVQVDATRFARQQLGGTPDFNTSAIVPAEPFRRRVERQQERAAMATDPGSGPQTEQAIELGLAFLSRCQAADGSWKLEHFAVQDGLPQLVSDTAGTGLALLAFQGAGYHHRDYRYAEVVRRGIDFLVRRQQADGDLFVPMDESSNQVVRFYSHSIAALALSEAYGMTQDPALREPAQRALDFIVQTQHAERGGWRYTPGQSSDTSVTGWMLMALKSGELANLDVSETTYAGIRRWCDLAQASPEQPHLYRYNPYAPDTATQRQGRLPSRTMTSVGLLMRLYLGWKPDDPRVLQGVDYLLQMPPSEGTPTNPQRDTYYWYYATQVLFHVGGQRWTVWWHEYLHPLLVRTQVRDGELAGSWDPFAPVPDRWAPHAGRLYVTAMNLLSLEVHYRHLPLYQRAPR